MSLRDIIRHELIGLNVEVKNSNNPSLIGIKGKIIDETKSMLKIKNKMIPKNQVTLQVDFKGKKLLVEGKLLFGKPEDRIKK